ncbi:hypothetical protein R3P38DRAFT_2828856 [Favolaschia claudopus]|uniref:RRM domain-containing protein n=1 Tax=Favolaschia claudopus TaxID=2862362 RepID=A0AAW0EAL7_9AGAR
MLRCFVPRRYITTSNAASYTRLSIPRLRRFSSFDGGTPQWPPFTTPPEALHNMRTSHGLTVCLHNIHPDAQTCEVIDTIMAGPIYRVEDLIENRARMVAVTFFDTKDAGAFVDDMTRHKTELFGRRLAFSWARGTAPTWNPNISRSITIWDRGKFGTGPELAEYLRPFGPIDRVALLDENGADRAFVTFLSSESGYWALRELQEAGATVNFMHDRSYVAASSRNKAIENCSQSVLIRGIPPQTTTSELFDVIRGGAVYRLAFAPGRDVAFVHFAEHTSAAYFLEHAVYRGVHLHGRRLNCLFLEHSGTIPRHLAQSFSLGASRCLLIEGVVNPDMLRSDCEHFGQVENITVSETTTSVSFVNIQHGITAFRLLPKRLSYEGLRVRFVKDPCAAPYDQDMTRAQSLQDELSSLLIPPGTEMPPPKRSK